MVLRQVTAEAIRPFNYGNPAVKCLVDIQLERLFRCFQTIEIVVIETEIIKIIGEEEIVSRTRHVNILPRQSADKGTDKRRFSSAKSPAKRNDIARLEEFGQTLRQCRCLGK